MVPYILGIGNEVFFGWGAICALIIGYCLISPYLSRLAEAQYEEQRRRLREYIIEHYVNVDTLTTSGQIDTEHARRTRERALLSTADSQDSCPICQDNMQFAVSGLCHHLFCGLCILEYFQIRGLHTCPLCRRHITMLTARFTREEREAPINSDLGVTRAHIINVLVDYNQSYLEGLSVWRQSLEIPNLVYHFVIEMFSNEGMIPLRYCVLYGFLLIALLIYLLFPYDILSEAHHGVFGFLDDVFLFLAVSYCIDFTYRRLVIRSDYFN